jgi:hypothetical protein
MNMESKFTSKFLQRLIEESDKIDIEISSEFFDKEEIK